MVHQSDTRKPTLLITGASNLLGHLLCEGLQDRYELIGQGAFDVTDDAESGRIRRISDLSKIEQECHIDNVISLAGIRVETGRWTKARKQQLLNHRLKEIQELVQFVAQRERKPKVLIFESSTHYYGRRENKRIFECATRQPFFLSELYAQWEDCTKQAERLTPRLVQMRIGRVLTNEGGLLRSLRRFLKLGLDLNYGNSHQWVPWIHHVDLVRLFEFALTNPRVEGAMNACSAHPVTQLDLMNTLRCYFGHNLTTKLPSVFVRALVGQKSELLTSGQRALPGEALKHGFSFEFKHLRNALDELQDAIKSVDPARLTSRQQTPLLESDVVPGKVAAKP